MMDCPPACPVRPPGRVLATLKMKPHIEASREEGLKRIMIRPYGASQVRPTRRTPFPLLSHRVLTLVCGEVQGCSVVIFEPKAKAQAPCNVATLHRSRLSSTFKNHCRPMQVVGAMKRVGLAYCMNQPWLTTSDCPVRALLGKAANSTATSATSSSVVNSPSTVSLSMIFLMTSCSLIPSI